MTAFKHQCLPLLFTYSLLAITSLMKTLLIVSHPYPKQSRAIAALQETAASLPGITVRNLESLYGSSSGQFDIAAEQQAHEQAERIIYLFPIHWFNLTPMLKAYLNEVWCYGWAFGPGGTALQGKQMQVVVTAGASAFTYSAEGLIRSTMDDVLTPMKASALYVGMEYCTPLAFHGAIDADKGVIAQYQAQLAAMLAV